MMPPTRVQRIGGRAMHRSAWNRYSANFAITEFYEDEMRRPTPHTQYP
jgi:hypothetical protein